MEQKSIVYFLGHINDVRKAKGKRHELLSLLVVMILAMLCGKTSLKGIARFGKAHRDELARYIPLPRGKAPSFSTLQRLSRRLSAHALVECFNSWMSQYIKEETIAVDGKSITSTVKEENGKQSFTSLVSMFGQCSHLVYQIGLFENDKKSEIHVVQELIRVFQVNKAVFTMDALHCQTKTVDAIVDSGNGYLVTVKRNQLGLYRAIEEKSNEKPEDSYSWRQTGHGHDLHCRIRVFEADAELKKKWKGLSRYIEVRRKGWRDGKELNTITYYISSESMSAWRFAKLVRGHRKIENNLHWTKDVVLKEDDCGLIDFQAASNGGVMRTMSLNLLVMAGYKSISEGISAMGEKVSAVWDVLTGAHAKSPG